MEAAEQLHTFSAYFLCDVHVKQLQLDELYAVLRDLKISSSGLVDQRGLFGTADVSPHFQSVEVAVTMATSAPSTELTALQREVLKRCPVYNLIRDSKARISVTWSVAAEASR